MSAETNVVTLSVSSYNQVKADNYRLNMFLDNIFNGAMISADHERMVFDSKNIEAAIIFCFPERYKKKMATLRTQNTRFGTCQAPEEGAENE